MDTFVMMSQNSTTQIKCTSNSHLYFSQSQYIHITNLEFIGCGGNLVKHVEKFVVEDTKFKGQENSGTVLELIETTAQIVNSTFVSNRNGTYRKCVLFSPELAIGGCLPGESIGGAVIATNSTIDISQSKFKDNQADIGGAIFAEQHSIINMTRNVFVHNSPTFAGGVLFSDSSIITIEASEFHNNSATFTGGVLFSDSSTITIEASEFHNNSANFAGGVLLSNSSTITIKASEFHNSTSAIYGGVLVSNSSIITIEASKFHNNSATFTGGVLVSNSSTITIETNEFYDNSATYGGVGSSEFQSNIKIEASGFHNNNATNQGGVLHSDNSIISIGSSNFTNNVSPIGAVIYARSGSKIQHNHSYLLMDDNLADRYAVIYLFDSEFVGYDSENEFTISNNLGSLVAFNSNITFTGYVTFVNDQPPQTASDGFQEGGAITLFQSNVFFDST